MSDNNEEKNEAVNPLDLSDEEFAKLDIESLPLEEESTEEDEDSSEGTETTSETEEEITEDTEEESTDDESNTEEESKEEESEEAGSEEGSEDKEEKKVEEEETPDTSEKDKEIEAKESDEKKPTDKKEETGSDAEVQLQKIFAPFKANGKEVKVDNIEDAITLMQKGANYNKKMAGLKPSLKILKMLDNNGLLDEEKLNYLIDLDKKDPEAIKKLVKESELDPLDIDVKAKTEYKPKSYTVDDKDVALDGILGDIQETDSGKKTLDIIANKWDDSSKQTLYHKPNLIEILNKHVESGVYQQISNVIESERMLGRLTDLSDIEAYQHVGKAIEANGGFKSSTSNVETPAEKKPIKKTVDPKLKQRKKAASSTKSTVSKKKEQAYNPLNMSDADFEKININTL